MKRQCVEDEVFKVISIESKISKSRILTKLNLSYCSISNLSLELFSNATTRGLLIVEKSYSDTPRSNKTATSTVAGFDRCRRFVSVNEREAEEGGALRRQQQRLSEGF